MYKMKKDYSNNEVKHIKDGEVEYLTFNALEKYSYKIKCIVTLRHGGVSEGVYNSLNFRMLGKDKKESVLKNLEIVSKKIGINEKEVSKGKQDHTDNILVLDNENKDRYEFSKENDECIDGYVIKDSGITALVTTADCNAIVIYDTKNNKVANVHSGWKGTTKKIYLKAIDKMKELFGTKVEDLVICVSPAILKCCFSSEDESFKKIFTDIWKDEKEYIYYEKENPKRFHIDLFYVITKDLLGIGVKKDNIHFANICTCCNHDDFYSYRYKTMKGEQDYGCMATIVKLL